MCDDAAIIMARTQITLDPETQRRARQRAADMGISLTEYVRRLVVRDLGTSRSSVTRTEVFDLGASGVSDVATNKDAMLAEAFGRSR